MKNVLFKLVGLVFRAAAAIAGTWWVLMAISVLAWFLMIQIGVLGCEHNEFGSFECSPDRWYAAIVPVLTGFWIVSFVILCDAVPITATELLFAIVFWTGTIIFVGCCIQRLARSKRLMPE